MLSPPQVPRQEAALGPSPPIGAFVWEPLLCSMSSRQHLLSDQTLTGTPALRGSTIYLRSACVGVMGMSGFHFRGGGGVNRAPQNWGGGCGKRAQPPPTNSAAELWPKSCANWSAENLFVEHSGIHRFVCAPKIWQVLIFLNPLDALIVLRGNIPFSFFPDFWVWVTSKARGSDSVGFWGSCQLSPFWGRGGSGRRPLSMPPPPRKRKPGFPCHRRTNPFDSAVHVLPSHRTYCTVSPCRFPPVSLMASCGHHCHVHPIKW